jgi:hypothetical protein
MVAIDPIGSHKDDPFRDALYPTDCGVNLWIVGKYNTGAPWEFIGVFDDEGKAVFACRDENHFVAPALLNERVPDEARDWPGLYYPLREAKPE